MDADLTGYIYARSLRVQGLNFAVRPCTPQAAWKALRPTVPLDKQDVAARSTSTPEAAKRKATESPEVSHIAVVARRKTKRARRQKEMIKTPVYDPPAKDCIEGAQKKCGACKGDHAASSKKCPLRPKPPAQVEAKKAEEKKKPKTHPKSKPPAKKAKAKKQV